METLEVPSLHSSKHLYSQCFITSYNLTMIPSWKNSQTDSSRKPLFKGQQMALG